MPTDLNFNFTMSQTDGRPMYLQIMDHIKTNIAAGDWPQGTKLPSIRELAVATTVSVITVKRAYQELESEGVIFTQAGKGSFVAHIDNLSQQLKEQEMEKHLIKAIEIAQSIGMNIQELSKTLQALHKDNTNTTENNHDNNK